MSAPLLLPVPPPMIASARQTPGGFEYEIERTEIEATRLFRNRSGRPQEVQDALNEINELGKLVADWDGEGAPAISEDVLALARSVIDHTYEEAERYGVRWVAPSIGPSPDGTVTLTWDHRDTMFSIDVEFDPPMVARVIMRGTARPERVVMPAEFAARELVRILGE